MQRTLLPLAVLLVAVLFLTACFEDGKPKAIFDDSVPTDVECRTVTTRFGGEHMLVRASIDSFPAGWFMLQSATSYLLVDSRHIDLSQRPEVGRGGFPRPCETPVTFHQVDSFAIGRMTIEHALVGAVDLSVLEDAFGEPIAGVVSFPAFQHAVVEIDMDANGGQGRVAFFNPEGYQLDRGEWTHMNVSRFEMNVPCTFERAVKGPYVIDTGFAGNAAIFSAYAVNKKLNEGREFVDKPTLTVCGESVDRETRIDKFTFAGHTFEDPIVSYMQPGSAADANTGQFAGLIGRGFLREFVLVTDVTHNRIAFVARGHGGTADSSSP